MTTPRVDAGFGPLTQDSRGRQRWWEPARQGGGEIFGPSAIVSRNVTAYFTGMQGPKSTGERVLPAAGRGATCRELHWATNALTDGLPLALMARGCRGPVDALALANSRDRVKDQAACCGARPSASRGFQHTKPVGTYCPIIMNSRQTC